MRRRVVRIGPGSSVAIYGAGPVGLATVVAAQFFGPAQIVAIDRDPHRLEAARRLGATLTIDKVRVRGNTAFITVSVLLTEASGEELCTATSTLLHTWEDAA